MLESSRVAVPQPSPQAVRFSWAWLGALPFFGFLVAFLLWPTLAIAVQSFVDQQGRPTLQNMIDLSRPVVLNSYWYTIQISVASSMLGALLGFLLAYAITIGALPKAIRNALISFCGVASNFAGVPLAFAFIATLGQLGIVTRALRDLGIVIYPSFSLYGFWGLTLTYTYFQIPLMVLIMVPALDSLRREWREAAESLGANAWQFWRYIALPILTPALLSTFILLFGNAFGAHATAFALTGGGAQGQVITILIGAQMSGDSLSNPGIGNAMAFGMIVIMGLTILLYSWLQRRSERWLRPA